VGVQQVSVISDALGYDVLAPRIDAAPRKLEVKTTASLVDKGLMRFFLTRNEYEQGRRAPESWSLVACHFVDMQVIILGWTPARTLMPYLPDDGNGRWAEALVRFPLSGLAVGIPSAI
jgi:hypothetical protein